MSSRRQLLAALASYPALPAIGRSLVDLVAAVKASICAVGTFNALDSPRFGFRGTGFFVGDGNLVATCAHVLPEVAAGSRPGVTTLAVQIGAVDALGELREAELVAQDRSRDLAVLRIKGRPGPPLALAPPARAEEGMEVALVGFPIGGVLGFRPATHRGVLAAVVASSLPGPSARQLNEGAVARLREGTFELYQLDATAYPGNSGGPLFDVESRQVIGIVNMVLVKGNRESALSHPTGITYAVPARYLAELLARI